MKNWLLAFYCDAGPGPRGRRFEDVLQMDDGALEREHDYIQWLFPTVTQSTFNPDAPTLDAYTVQQLRNDLYAQARMLAALRRILGFLGLELDDSDPDDVLIGPGSAFEARAAVWLTFGNHNYRRITRVLASLTALGHRPMALALFDCLERLHRTHGGRMGAEPLAHWRRQVLQ